MRIGFIGYGSMARKVIEVLAGQQEISVAAILIRNPQRYASEFQYEFVDHIDALIDRSPDVIAECATQSAVANYAVKIAEAGIPQVIASIGALADEDLRKRLVAASRRHNSPVVLPAGAVGGIDALAAASYGEIGKVVYRGVKPAASWRGTPAEDMVNLDALDGPTTFFRGNARDAAILFPKNSNVAATIALAGIGFEETCVELIADPNSDTNQHEVFVDSDSSTFDIRLQGKASPDNPKTSILSALSVGRAISNLQSALVL